LFPVAYPPSDSLPEEQRTEYEKHLDDVVELFNFLGIFLAKSMQDQRLVDLPFSYSFLKVMSSFNGRDRTARCMRITDQDEEELLTASDSKVKLDMLSLADLAMIDPVRGELLVQLNRLVEEKQLSGDIEAEIMLDMNGVSVSLEDLA